MKPIKLEIPCATDRQGILLGLTNSGIKSWVEEKGDFYKSVFYVCFDIPESTETIQSEQADSKEKPKQTKGDYTPIKTYFSTEPIILDGVVCTLKPASRDEMDLFWHDVLTSNGDID